MSNIVNVEKQLDFSRGVASHRPNVLGPMNPKKVVLQDYFTGIALDTTNVWATDTTGTTGPATIAISEVQGGSVLITTGTVDNNSCSMSTAIIFSGTKKAICEIDLTITDVSGTGLFVGFSDAKDEANASIALHYPDDTFTSPATDAAGFVIDADHSTSSIMCASTQAAGGDTTPVDTAVDWADGERRKLRVELNSTTATFWMSGTADLGKVDAVASIASSVTAATLLCVTVQAMTRANDGANTVRVHSIKVWENE